MNAIFQTDQGKIREHNEDNGAVFIKDKGVLAVVADGMGGHLAGEEASARAVATIEEAWEAYDLSDSSKDAGWLEETALQANLTIFNYAESHPECKGMGTTLVMALCRPETLTVAHVGDSRCYLISDQETIEQITEDHSLVNELVKSGQLSEEDADFHPRKNVLLRALGTDRETKVDVKQMEWSTHQSILLCSDGLTNMVSKSELLEIMTSSNPLEEKAQCLIEFANEAGGHDNISVSLVVNEEGEQQ